MKNDPHLSRQQESVVKIAAIIATSDVDKLKIELAQGLDHGLTISETRELLVELYAYCGFPRNCRPISGWG